MIENVHLTIAIPTYNRRETLQSLVNAIIPQLRPEDELLVIDDGSNDGTAGALRGLPAVRMICHPTNYGMTKTWNACLQYASRDWVCLVHDDDTIAPDAISTIRRVCSIAGGPCLIGHNSPASRVDDRLRFRFFDPGTVAVLHSSLIPSAVTIHKSIVDALGGFDERFLYSPDVEYFARVCARYPSLVIESPPVLHYNIHPHNYQFRTWRESDFLSQLEQIEKLVVSNSGLVGARAEDIYVKRMNKNCTWMLEAAIRSNDQTLLRAVSLSFAKRRYLCRRLVVAAKIARVFHSFPAFLWYAIRPMNPAQLPYTL